MYYFHTTNYSKDNTIPYYNFIRGVGMHNANKYLYIDEVEKFIKDGGLNKLNTNKRPISFEQNLIDEAIYEMEESIGLTR